MYEKGEFVIYGNNGVCCIEAIGIPKGTPMAKTGKSYYTLKPVAGKGTIFAPVDTKVYMRPVMTKKEADALIDCIPEIMAETAMGHDIKELSEHYRSCLETHDCKDLVKLIKTIWKKEKCMCEHGKKLAKTEQDFCKLATGLLQMELAVAEEIPSEQVEEYIRHRLGK